MKFLLAFTGIVLLSAFYSGADYPVAKLYAFQQKISRGANFSSSEKNKPTVNYKVYAEVKKRRTISVTSVWINGRKTTFETQLVNSPVTYEKTLRLNKKDEQEILIPATANDVFFISINGTEEKISIPSRYKKYSLLVEYKEGNKTYYVGSKAWEEIPAEVNQ